LDPKQSHQKICHLLFAIFHQPEKAVLAPMKIATEHTDELNARILAYSEDKIPGFVREPFREIARLSGISEELVITRIRLMLETGIVRRVRQTLLTTSLAQGALVAWKVDPKNLEPAFDFMFREDPFSGHVVVRSTDQKTAGSEYRLWTTIKVPPGYSLAEHTGLLGRRVGAEKIKVMPAKGIFALGVGHVRRKVLEPGARSEHPAPMLNTDIVPLSDIEWRVLTALKREFAVEEICSNPWASRAAECDLPLATFCEIAAALNEKKIIGRFSTFLEHVKPSAAGIRVTRFNGLFHWAVPTGREIEAGSEIGRHEILTHCYWREGGPEFSNVNIMAVAHGTDKDRLLAHKAAIDEHLSRCRIPVSYTNVFWGGRSEIKPSEISPQAYRDWLAAFQTK
jgi:AsnC-like ligand binding domain/Siroheme decarboxylase NirDL-like HTH domain